MAIKFTGPRISWGMLWVVLSWRWFTGNTLDGDPRTDAGWFRKGTRSVDNRYPHPTRWQLLPRVTRSGIRLGSLLLPVIALVVWVVWPSWFYRVSVLLTVVLLVIIVRAQYGRHQKRSWNKHVLKPFLLTAAPMVTQAPAALIRDAHVDMMTHPDDGVVASRVTLPIPAEFNPGESGRKDLVRLANERFTGEWQLQLNVKRWPFYIALSRLADPREKFSYEELMNVIEKHGGPGKIILGAGTTDFVVADIV